MKQPSVCCREDHIRKRTIDVNSETVIDEVFKLAYCTFVKEDILVFPECVPGVFCKFDDDIITRTGAI